MNQLNDGYHIIKNGILCKVTPAEITSIMLRIHQVFRTKTPMYPTEYDALIETLFSPTVPLIFIHDICGVLAKYDKIGFDPNYGV